MAGRGNRCGGCPAPGPRAALEPGMAGPPAWQGDEDAWFSPSRRDDLDGALLEVRLLADRVGGVQRDLVDQPGAVELRHEDHAAGRLVASARLHPRAHLAA